MKPRELSDERNTTEGTRRRLGLRWIWILTAGLATIFIILYAIKSGGTAARAAGQGPPAQARGMPVVAAEARQGDINVYMSGLGSVTPLHTVTVKTRVDGQLMKVMYREGQMVTSGSILAEIDTRPFDAQLAQFEGQLMRDRALLENARLDLQRYKELIADDSISKQQYDTQKSLVRQLEGTVKSDQGQVDNAKLQLVYCRVSAPVGGRIGLRLVDPGNIVHATDTTGLAVITQLQPITVIFPVPEDNLPQLLDKIKTGGLLPVEAFNREQTRKLASGRLLTLDNQIDPTTGTVRLKAEFENKNTELFPNQFVNARVLVDTRRAAVVIPTGAVQRGPRGPFVYLVKADQTVAVHPIKVGPSEGDQVAVDEGLSPGDKVVVEGADRLREGSKVQLHDAAGTGAPQKAPASGGNG